jgi:hypothetical protein
MKAVTGFSPGQTTKSFPEGAPQRESYESDVACFRAEERYAKEWCETYCCTGCRDLVCPQCGKMARKK